MVGMRPSLFLPETLRKPYRGARWQASLGSPQDRAICALQERLATTLVLCPTFSNFLSHKCPH